MYDDPMYANSRLQSTIVLQKTLNEPVVISMVNADWDVRFSILGSQAVRYCHFEELDLTPVKLGFAYGRYGVAYLTRVPMRRDWRQGLRSNNYMSVFGIDKRWINQGSLRRTILGRYIDLELAFEESYNLDQIIPISRNFAIRPKEGKNFSILYKWYGEVGDFVREIPELSKKYIYLTESFEEEVLNAN